MLLKKNQACAIRPKCRELDPSNSSEEAIWDLGENACTIAGSRIRTHRPTVLKVSK
jgi:hypothetical protein